MSIYVRLKELRQETGLSQEDFATSIGLKRPNYAQIEGGKQYPTLETIKQIVRIYNKTYDWLIDGKEIAPNVAPIVAPNDKIEDSKTSFHAPKIITMSQGKENILFVPVKAAAGYLNGYGDPEYIESLTAYKLPGFESGSFRMFEVNGHSMVPTLKSRDRIIGKWCEIQDIKDSYVHVLVTRNDGVVVKRVLNRLKKDGVLILKSDGNRYEYPDMIVDPDEVIECWSGVGKISRDLSGPADLYSRIDDLEGRLAIVDDVKKRMADLERLLKTK
ncbi:XRE family transcriptional regulator [Mucilaginibacter lappiensis]|uniref:Transcriptional regulator with XRE-family HTH domain n=1 Tax=Mucilaginibacter lappiensis TaxID=354630 RepID=A0A841J9V2_9SPHI|nr:LexA family transcriptional regulator [Mucilaginibacter lappiensis]MBB6127883.1 transcriptional regulator with XRE-family HTH domain [Mucilaginibacter lappiensis]